MQVLVKKVSKKIPLSLDWDGGIWNEIDAFSLNYVVPESSEIYPDVNIKIARDTDSIAVLFRVQDQYVRSVCQEPNGPVCTDSCVEWFVEPIPCRGYFNFELNAGGCLHLSHVEDPTRIPGRGFKKHSFPSQQETAQIDVVTSMPEVVEPEIKEPVTWYALISVPFSFFEKMLGAVDARSGAVWRGNFYKCGDKTSHPHWLTWNLVGELNFHRPQDFGPIVFD
ncbi:MAG: carbohydrate-binding family 9-like protein [Kiritimatiellae bacterium]|jgi:hypothetical protein|nr:carbohydrate-binding family 9-like protein [Kiritimatiellia bacterium]